MRTRPGSEACERRQPSTTADRRRAAALSPVVTLYGRPGCHLCDDARAIVGRARSRVPFELVEIDIERDDELLKALLERIPVVTVDGAEHSELFVDEEALVAALSSAHP